MRRRKDPFEKPWVIIAAVVGIIAVIVIALVFFMGGGSSAPASSGQPSASPGTPSAQQTSVVGVAPTVIKTQAPVTVPQEDVYVRVSYIGGFSGTYGMEGNMTTMRNSGDRVFVVENATGDCVRYIPQGRCIHAARDLSSRSIKTAQSLLVSKELLIVR